MLVESVPVAGSDAEDAHAILIATHNCARSAYGVCDMPIQTHEKAFKVEPHASL